MNNVPIELVLPWPPSVNDYWKRSKQGIYLSNDAKAYRLRIIDLIDRFDLKLLLNEPMHVDMLYHFPKLKRVRDIDNYTKGMYDSLTHAELWEDDSLIKKQCIEIVEDHGHRLGLVHMTITPWG